MKNIQKMNIFDYLVNFVCNYALFTIINFIIQIDLHHMIQYHVILIDQMKYCLIWKKPDSFQKWGPEWKTKLSSQFQSCLFKWFNYLFSLSFFYYQMKYCWFEPKKRSIDRFWPRYHNRDRSGKKNISMISKLSSSFQSYFFNKFN